MEDPLEAAAGELRARYPDWRVWAVRNAVSRTVTWSAEPARYPLHAGSPRSWPR